MKIPRKITKAPAALLRLKEALPSSWDVVKAERSQIVSIEGIRVLPARPAWEALGILICALLAGKKMTAEEIRDTIRLEVSWTHERGLISPTIPGSLPGHYEYAIEKCVLPYSTDED